MIKHYEGLLLIIIGLGAGVVSMGLNVVHSFHIALWSVPIVILSEGARISLPFIAVKRGWTTHLKATFGAVVVLCLLTTTAFLADSFAKLLLGRGHEETVQTQKTEAVERLKTELLAIDEKLSSKKLNQLATDEINRQDKPGCGTNCIAYKERAGKAEQRERLEAELKELTTETQTAAPVEVSGLGLLIGWAFGVGREAGSAFSMILFGGAILYCLDLLVYLIIPGAKYYQEDRAKAKIDAFAPLTIKPTKIDAKGNVKVCRDEAYRRLISHLLDMPEGAMLTSRRQLCKVILGTENRKTTFNDWMNGWIAAGDLLAITRGKKELISLPKAA